LGGITKSDKGGKVQSTYHKKLRRETRHLMATKRREKKKVETFTSPEFFSRGGGVVWGGLGK